MQRLSPHAQHLSLGRGGSVLIVACKACLFPLYDTQTQMFRTCCALLMTCMGPCSCLCTLCSQDSLLRWVLTLLIEGNLVEFTWFCVGPRGATEWRGPCPLIQVSRTRALGSGVHLGPVRFAEKQAETLFPLICCERKTLFWLKRQVEKYGL